MTWAAITNGAEPEVQVLVNNVIRIMARPANTIGFVSAGVNGIIRLEAGDVVSFKARRSASLASTIQAAYSFAQIMRIGPDRWT